MNQIIFQAQVQTAPELSTTEDNKNVARYTLEVAAYKEGDPSLILNATSWGATAKDAAENIKAGDYLVVEGSLRLDKGRPPGLQVSRFHSVNPQELPGVNSVSLVGRAGRRDPEVRYFESGKVVANLSLAVNRIRRDDPPDWFNLEIWGKQAQVAADHVRKGSLLGIGGSAFLQTWAAKDSGEARSKVVIRVDRLELLGSRRDSESAENNTEEAPY